MFEGTCEQVLSSVYGKYTLSLSCWESRLMLNRHSLLLGLSIHLLKWPVQLYVWSKD
jgi:hypothetical protein